MMQSDDRTLLLHGNKGQILLYQSTFNLQQSWLHVATWLLSEVIPVSVDL